MILLKQKPDSIGAIASTLCLIHCLATPFVFIAQSCTLTCCNGVPMWWGSIDYIFLIISFFTVYRSNLNEKAIYIPAIALIMLHLYNKKYCQCHTNTCCTNEK